MKIRPGIELSNLTDTGCVREKNEDYYGYAEPDDDATFHSKGRLAVIADGMGGHEGGEVASGIAVDVIRRVYFEPAAEHPAEALEAAFREAHSSILEYVEQHPALRGMGTTCTAIALLDHQMYYGHIGDSRLYLMRDSKMSQLTEDHSVVGRMVREGLLSPEEASQHPDRNVLTAALGMEGGVAVNIPQTPVQLEDNDLLILCTDGLHGLVGDEEMLTVARHNSPSNTCRTLVEMAKERGGFDNITLQILRIVPQ